MVATTDRSSELSGTMIFLCILSLITFSARIFTRARISRSMGKDDVFLAISLVLYLLFCSFSLVHVHYSTGRHMDTLRPEQITQALKWYYVGEMFYVASATVLRISIASLLLRIAQSRWIVSVIWTVVTISTAAGIVATAELTFQCQPIDFFWNLTKDPTLGHCVDSRITTIIGYTHAAASCLCDWTFGILPWIICRDLMNRKQRFQVAGLLCFANFLSIATTIRFYSIHQLMITQDFLFDSVPLADWSAAEVGTGIVAFSIAALYPLQQWIKQKRRSTYDGMATAVPEIISLELPSKDSHWSHNQA